MKGIKNAAENPGEIKYCNNVPSRESCTVPEQLSQTCEPKASMTCVCHWSGKDRIPVES